MADGGYASWKKVLAGAKTGEWTPAKITDMVKASGLRGRGGAGFPCGLKWTFVPTKDKRGDKPVYLLCNADESEPGTFKDRLLIENDPHQILEGMMLASFALEVKHAYIYIRGEMVHGAEILNAAVAEAHAKGFLGTTSSARAWTSTITVHRGAGAYICGEETALIESLEGKRGHPRIKPPFPAVVGRLGLPDRREQRRDALLRQAHPRPRRRVVQGRSAATRRTRARSSTAVSGHVEKPGVYEAPIGDPVGGAPRDGGRRARRAEAEGRDSRRLLGRRCSRPPRSRASRWISTASPPRSPCSARPAIIVMDETTDIPKAVTNIAKFYAHESCGQCTPCREGTPWLLKMLRRIVNGEGKKTDLDLLLQISNQMGNGMTICVFADAAIAPVISGITKFREEFEAYIAKSSKPGV